VLLCQEIFTKIWISSFPKSSWTYRYINDHDIERFYRAAKVLEIYEGTKEIEKLIIARRVLGRY
jgi:alkylation response protein AidB-like acyl-CoA dehydrogenase